MKTLNKQNQHKIGFDIDCLPKWATFIFQDLKGRWAMSIWDAELYCVEDAITDFQQSTWGYLLIPKQYAPKNFKGDWSESLFKIEIDLS